MALLEITRKMLRSLGWNPIGYSDGVESLRLKFVEIDDLNTDQEALNTAIQGKLVKQIASLFTLANLQSCGAGIKAFGKAPGNFPAGARILAISHEFAGAAPFAFAAPGTAEIKVGSAFVGDEISPLTSVATGKVPGDIGDLGYTMCPVGGLGCYQTFVSDQDLNTAVSGDGIYSRVFYIVP